MISRITLQTQRSAATSSVLAVIGACLAGAILLLLTGHDPWTVYRLIVERGLLDLDGLTESLKKMAPLLIITAGLLTCLRAGIWNIGIDGQVVIGAIACGVVAGELAGDLPRALLLIVGAVAGGVANAYVLVFNSTTGHGELWHDTNWSDIGNRVQVATFDDIDQLTELTGLSASNVAEWI